MRKILFLVLSLFAIATFGQSWSEKDDARKLLRSEAGVANELLKGHKVDIATIFDGCEFYDDAVHYYYTVDEELVTVAAMKNRSKEVQQNLKMAFENSRDTKIMVELLELLNGRISCHYTGNRTGDKLVITIQF